MNPTFSIAIPAFKGSFLKECIDSILSQTFGDFELIIVNDNSPEDLDSIVGSFSDPRIKYRKNREGFGAYNVIGNWNECLKYATGAFFMCIGDDDRLLPDCLALYKDLINSQPGFSIYHSGTQLINARSEIIDLQESRPLVESAYSMIWHRWCSARKTYIGDFLFRTSSLKKIGGFIWFPYAWGSDEQTAYLVASETGIANMQNYGFQYRVNDQTITYSRTNYQGKIEAHRMAKEWYRSFFDNHQPSDGKDRVFFDLLNNIFDAHFSELYKQNMKDDFCFNGLKNFLYWIRQRNKYGLSLKDIIFCYAIGLKKRLSL